MAQQEVAFLGPYGTYSHLVAQKRYGEDCRAVALPTILDVCRYVSRHPTRKGIIPIENSSGGAVYETVDILLANKPKVNVVEELSLLVKLALLARKGERISILYSHFAPLEHCDTWIRRHLPRVERRVVSSTAVAAHRAASEVHAAALANKAIAPLCGLDVINYPVEADVPNVTTFLAIEGKKRPVENLSKTTLAARTPNTPGALCTFLETFRDEAVNLSRIISRPIRGCPKEYAFLVDLEGGTDAPNVRKALRAARRTCVELRVVGSYQVRPVFRS